MLKQVIFVYRLLEAKGIREAVARTSNEYAVWLHSYIKLIGLSEYPNLQSANILMRLHKAPKVDGCGRRGSVPFT
ncbi:hypothetical protein OAQ35_04640 [Litorivicinus sp.]|nr:hypothetical protein [Litorivicinus sp.]